MNPEQLHSFTGEISQLVKDHQKSQDEFQQLQKQEWDYQKRRNKISGICSSIQKCDGELSTQIRNFLYDIDMIVPRFEGDHKAILKIVTKTSTGALAREIQRYVTDNHDTNWQELKSHLERTFLSTDESEKLRCVVEETKQAAAETLASYNRRMREMVRRAYGSTLTVDAERLVLRAYLRGLRSVDLAKKASLEMPSQTFTEALTYTEKIEAGLERFMALSRNDVGEKRQEEPMDTAAVSRGMYCEVAAVMKTLADGQQQIIEQQKLLVNAAVGRQQPVQDYHQPPGQDRRSGPLKCFACGGNHLRRNCPEWKEWKEFQRGRKDNNGKKN